MGKKSQSVGYRFAMLHRLSSFFISRDLKALGITQSQVPFMAELFHADGPMTQDQLSAELEIDKAATARTLDQMEKKKMVQRRVNSQNRRQKMVSPTPRARAFEERFFKALRGSGEIFLSNFSQGEKEMVLRLLDRMLENARKEKYGRQ